MAFTALPTRSTSELQPLISPVFSNRLRLALAFGLITPTLVGKPSSQHPSQHRSIGGVGLPISSQPLALWRSGLLVHHPQKHRVLQEINVTHLKAPDDPTGAFLEVRNQFMTAFRHDQFKTFVLNIGGSASLEPRNAFCKKSRLLMDSGDLPIRTHTLRHDPNPSLD
jgi:hypothetical protein